MADGQRYLLPTFSNPLASQYSSSSLITNDLLVKSLLNQLAPEQPSPSKAPTLAPANQTLRGMFPQNHQQGHNSRITGAPGRQNPMQNYFPQQVPHLHQQVSQHHQLQQQEHSGHGAAANMMGHSPYSGGVMANASPFSGNNMQVAQHGATARGGQAQQLPEHWMEQLRLHKESERAHSMMTENMQPHYYARLKASENRGIGGPAISSGGSGPAADGEEDRRRPYQVINPNKRQDWHNLDMTGQGIRTLSPALFMYEFLQELYLGSNQLTFLPPAIGKLRRLRLLEASNNQISELPPEIGMCTDLKTLLVFNNRITSLPTELGFLYHLEMLGIEGNPLNPGIKQELMERGTKSLVSKLLEQAPISNAPAHREHIVLNHHASSNLEHVKVLTWNILCEKFATPQTYGYTPPRALKWEYRKMEILKEIREKDADILCLQEIAGDAFNDFFSPHLAQEDYRGILFQRPKAKTMRPAEALSVDGCAVFYKNTKWHLIDKQLVDYANIAINRPDMKKTHDVFNRVMLKDNVGLICFFESRVTGARMIVANTHLAWEPHLADVKLVQTGILMDQLAMHADKFVRWKPLTEKDKKVYQGPKSGDEDEDGSQAPVPFVPSQEYRNITEIPLIVCGDYNSTIDSSVYDLLQKGRVPPDHSDFGEHTYGNFTKNGIEHPFNMRSAYYHLAGSPHELAFTNYTPGFQGVIDYIWYSTNTLEVVSLLGPPDQEHLRRVPGFPNYHFPADHIQLVAEFVIKARKEKKMVTEPDFGSSSKERRSERGKE
ncbi:Endonuclease/exonuclease/phosphatase [Rhypophila decipiens]|uniref:CCR4-Not complex 3'-5'-exoribonuclease subunit Ccr4 n=1 Tax=Rhypophila decipiens TaxID=261697 RepID=A0AAN7B355_9PEZI|nr:Endonuclease/exonuclease/phosphatase [Rhypophila decipiens]